MSDSTYFCASSRPFKDLTKQNLQEAAEQSGKAHLSTFFSPHTQSSNSELGGFAAETEELVEVVGVPDSRSADSRGVARLGGGADE